MYIMSQQMWLMKNAFRVLNVLTGELCALLLQTNHFQQGMIVVVSLMMMFVVITATPAINPLCGYFHPSSPHHSCQLGNIFSSRLLDDVDVGHAGDVPMDTSWHSKKLACCVSVPEGLRAKTAQASSDKPLDAQLFQRQQLMAAFR